jgi:hypothetical protein
MESEAKHWKVSKERAAVEKDKALRKRNSGLELSAGRRGEPKELIRRDLIPKEARCCLQEGVQPCKSGTVKKEPLQKNWDLGKLWTAQAICRRQNKGDLLCESDTMQGTRAVETRER